MVTEFPLPQSTLKPQYIASGPDGNLWFTESRNSVGRITPSGTITLFRVSPSNSSGGGITSGPDGNIWFTDIKNNLIDQITPSGNVTSFSASGLSPKFITSGPSGNVWFTAPDQYSVGEITPAGSVTTFGPFVVSGTSDAPEAITAGPGGAVWFTEATILIGSLTPGGLYDGLAIPSPAAIGITVDHNGNVWYTRPHGDGVDEGEIGEMPTNGNFVEYSLPGNPQMITTGADGNLWFVLKDRPWIGVFLL